MTDRQESRKMAVLDFVNEEHWGKEGSSCGRRRMEREFLRKTGINWTYVLV